MLDTAGKFEREELPTLSMSSDIHAAACIFPLPWSAYVRLLSIKNDHARSFYETEALRGAWSVRQLDRQIESQFYERTALSKNKAAMLRKGTKAKPQDCVSLEEEIKDPYVLEFLRLKDEYSETDLEEALIRHLESFLLELGEISPSSPARKGFESEMNGTVWTLSSSTAGCAAWCSST